MKNGSTLIEILIAIFIFSFLAINTLKTEINALNLNQSQYYYALAEQQILNMRARIQIDQQHLQQEVDTWNQYNKNLLPHGEGFITAKNPYTISLSWYDKWQNKKIKISNEIYL